MKKKTMYGILIALAILAALYFNNEVPIWINLTVSVISMRSIYELFTVFFHDGTGSEKTIWKVIRENALASTIVIFVGIFPFLPFDMVSILAWYVYTLVFFVLLLVYRNAVRLEGTVVVYALSMIIAVCLRLLIHFRDAGGNTYGVFHIIMILSIACITDTGAYFFGSFLGRRKLCEDISPKKTVEGVFGGVGSCVVMTLLFALGFEMYSFDDHVSINYLYLAAIAFVGSFIAMLGDLSFSFVKRRCNVKDFGNVLPGHGGVLDRIDSIIFVIPFVFFTFRFLPVIQY